MTENQEIHDQISPSERKLTQELEPWEREVEGMYRAIQQVHQKASDSTRPGFNKEDILAVNKAVMNDPFNPHLFGRLRRAIVKMSAIVRGEHREAVVIPVHPDQLPQLFEKFSQELSDKTATLSESTPISEVIEFATFAHHELIRLHPFIDGNGRTARLLVDFIFKRAGLPYVVDWGAKNDEYKDVVDRSFRGNNPNFFKIFLAGKLLERIGELEREGFSKKISITKAETISYLNHLIEPNAS